MTKAQRVECLVVEAAGRRECENLVESSNLGSLVYLHVSASHIYLVDQSPVSPYSTTSLPPSRSSVMLLERVQQGLHDCFIRR